MYSTLSCPKGCSLSAGLPATLIAISVTTLLPASERLFTASAVTAMLPHKSPTANLPAQSKAFAINPNSVVTKLILLRRFLSILRFIILQTISKRKRFQTKSEICHAVCLIASSISPASSPSM